MIQRSDLKQHKDRMRVVHALLCEASSLSYDQFICHPNDDRGDVDAVFQERFQTQYLGAIRSKLETALSVLNQSLPKTPTVCSDCNCGKAEGCS